MAHSFQELLDSLHVLADEHDRLKAEVQSLQSENAALRAAVHAASSAGKDAKGSLPPNISDCILEIPGAVLDDILELDGQDRLPDNALSAGAREKDMHQKALCSPREFLPVLVAAGALSTAQERKSSKSTASDATSSTNTLAVVPSRSLSMDSLQDSHRIFLSHKQSNGQDAVLSLKMFLSERLPLAHFWLDLEQNPTANGMMDGVKNCTHFILFCTQGVTESKWILMEVRRAVESGKQIILVQETDPRHGAPDMSELIREAPADVRHVFEQNVAIPWYRDPSFRAVSLDKICERLSATANDVGSQATDQALIYGDSGEPVFDNLFAIFCSLAGLPLPGAGRAAIAWLRFQQVVIILSLITLAARIGFPEGPSYLDQRDNVATFSLVLSTSIANSGLRSILQSALMREIVEFRIQSDEISRTLRKWTRWLTFAGISSLVLVLALGKWQYTQSFFDPYYPNKSTSHGVVFFIQGLMWVLLLIPCVTQIWGSLVLILAVSVIVFMDLASCFKHFGVEVWSMSDTMTQANETDLVRFQCAYIEAWRNRSVLFSKVSRLIVFFGWWWTVNTAMHLYYALCHMWGTEHPLAGRGEENLHLAFRILPDTIFDVVVMMPFIISFSFEKLKSWATRLIFTKPTVQTSAMLFLTVLKLDFPVGPFYANASMLPYFLAAMAMRIALYAFEFHVYFS